MLIGRTSQSFIECFLFARAVALRDVHSFPTRRSSDLSEINPRFGGGYPHAFEMGCNFMSYIVRNLQGKTNESYDGFKYEKDYVMMKYDRTKIIHDTSK